MSEIDELFRVTTERLVDGVVHEATVTSDDFSPLEAFASHIQSGHHDVIRAIAVNWALQITSAAEEGRKDMGEVKKAARCCLELIERVDQYTGGDNERNGYSWEDDLKQIARE